MLTTTTDNNTKRIMPARGVVSRELRDLAVGGTLLVPFKYTTKNNIHVAVNAVRKEGLDFDVDATGYDFAIITRLK